MKQFFPIIKDRLTAKIKLTTYFTAIVTAHGKTKAYLHRFKITESPECPCDGGNQTVDHILYDCIKLQREIERERETDTQLIKPRLVASEKQ
jgi:hypothetical protein